MAFEQRGINILHMHVVLYSLEAKVHILDHANNGSNSKEMSRACLMAGFRRTWSTDWGI